MNALRRMTGPAVLIALAVLWSNLWGLFRDSRALALFDSQSIAAYAVAIQAPFQAPQVIGIALAAAMVPILVELSRQGKEVEAGRVAAGITITLALILLPLAALGIWLTPELLRFYAWNSSAPVEFLKAVELQRILFLYFLISGTTGAIGATLQSAEQFKILALGQLVPNVVIVATMLAFHRSLGIDSQAIGVVLGGAAYLAVVLPAAYRFFKPAPPPVGRNGIGEMVPWWRLPAARRIGVAVAPLMLVNLADFGSSQLVIARAVSWVEKIHPSTFQRFVPASKILQVPQGIFLAALATVLLPLLSRYAAGEDREGLAAAASAGIRMVLFTVTPTIILLGSLALPIINILFRHGQFSETQAVLAAPLVGVMAPYVLFSSVAEVLVLTLLALKKVWALLAVQLASLGISAALSWMFAVGAGLPGVAIAISLIALANLGLLFGTVEHYVQLHDWQEMRQFVWKLAVACIALWLTLRVGSWLCSGYSGGRGLAWEGVQVSLTVLLAAAVYVGVSEALQIREWLGIRSAVTRLAGGAREDVVHEGGGDSKIET